MALLENLPPDIQCEIAVDMIIKSSSMIDREYEKIIEDVADFNPRDYKRWYDKNPNIHLAIESLKDLSEEEREKIVQEFSEKIINLNNINLDDIESENQ